MNNTYWANEDNDMIYKADVRDFQEGVDGKSGYIVYGLELVCGKEYPVDSYNVNGLRWCSPDYFVEDVQYETVVQYFEMESLTSAMINDGFHQVAGLPDTIYEWIDED